MKKTSLTLSILLILFAGGVWGEYLRLSEAEAFYCEGWVIQTCGFSTVAVVQDNDGNLFELSKVYKNPSYKKLKDGSYVCKVRVSSESGLWMDVLKKITDKTPTFMTLNNEGELEEINGVEEISFKCKKN